MSKIVRIRRTLEKGYRNRVWEKGDLLRTSTVLQASNDSQWGDQGDYSIRDTFFYANMMPKEGVNDESGARARASALHLHRPIALLIGRVLRCPSAVYISMRWNLAIKRDFAWRKAELAVMSCF